MNFNLVSLSVFFTLNPKIKTECHKKYNSCFPSQNDCEAAFALKWMSSHDQDVFSSYNNNDLVFKKLCAIAEWRYFYGSFSTTFRVQSAAFRAPYVKPVIQVWAMWSLRETEIFKQVCGFRSKIIYDILFTFKLCFHGNHFSPAEICEWSSVFR